MGRITSRAYYILALLLISALIYYIHYLIFRDLHHIFLYLVGDIAFVFIQVLLVTLILQKILEEREKSVLLKKLNMVIGAFFSEAGTSLLRMLASYDHGSCEIRDDLTINEHWSKADFTHVCRKVNQYRYEFTCTRKELAELRNYLLGKRDFLLRLLENPNLLEHDTFTELLWAVFHLTEELSARGELAELPDTDIQHLMVDVGRVYAALTKQWLAYMEHLRGEYPFLFSFAMRTNPFTPNASVEITK